jgi:AcrR family transcriptional regulator
MARKINPADYAARRDAILDAAQRLVYTRGYANMAIQDLIAELGISKGAFYHYFASKGEVLEALVERMVALQLLPLTDAVINDPSLPALDKLHQYFDLSFSWKSGRKAFMLDLMRVWVADENAVVRQKLLTLSTTMVTPILEQIIRQGVAEGVFDVRYPAEVGKILIYTFQGLGDTMVALLLDPASGRDPAYLRRRLEDYCAALNDTVERLLGTAPGALHLIDLDLLATWFTAEPAPVLDKENDR